MPDTLAHPAPRAVHAVTNALHILRSALVEPRSLERFEQVSRAIELLSTVPEDIAACQVYIDQQEANIATMVEESNETHRALNDVNRRLSIAHQELEHLYIGASMDMERHTTRFNTVVRLRTLLDAPAVATEPQSPRLAAGAR